MKKRLFSILIAVVMIATAINFAPVTEVMASINFGTSTNGAKGKYEWDYITGHWDSSKYFYNDNDYTNTTLSGYVNSNNTISEANSSTRHVTMFNDCDPHYNANVVNKSITPFYQIQYHQDGSSWVTNRDVKSGDNKYVQFKTIDNTVDAAAHYGVDRTSTDPTSTFNKYWNYHTANTNKQSDHTSIWAPFLTYGHGCQTAVQKSGFDVSPNHDAINTTAEAQSWANSRQGYETFYTPSDGNPDMRMAFRNFYNTDECIYNPSGREKSSKTGLNIAQYDYLEFDIYVHSQANWTKERNTADNRTAYYVYLYYEPNCTAPSYVDYNGSCIEGYDRINFNFSNQLFPNGATKTTEGKWQTIRLAIPDSIKNATTAPTVKQITIRMIGGALGNQPAVSIDDIRFVKNDDHIGKVITHDGNGNKIDDNLKSQYQYPSGNYYMINDFEFSGDLNLTTAHETTVANQQKGVYKSYTGTKGGGGNKIIDVYPIIRAQEINTNDSLAYMGTYNNSWDALAWAWDTTNTHNVAGAKEGVVTQGDYGANITARESTVYTVGGWDAPIYYERRYDTGMNLSNFTHFSMDVFIRSRGSNGDVNATGSNHGLPRVKDDSALKGVVFAIELFNDTPNANGVFNQGASVYFFLPYSAECWENQNQAPDSQTKTYGTILPLGTKGEAGKAGQVGATYFEHDGTHTAHGSLRFTFTRADLLAAATAQGIDLTNVKGMRFLWCNKKGDSTYESFLNNTTSGNRIDHADVVLDNFIAYTPDINLTVQNQVDDPITLDGNNQYFLYDIYGGYRSNDADRINTELGVNANGNNYDGVNDFFTQKVNTTIALPVNGKATIYNIPFNSYYISQQNWSWRYGTPSLTISTPNDPYANESDKNLFKTNGNTIAILPRVSLDNSRARSVPIYQLMKQPRNITITFTNKVTKTETIDNTRWLDHNTADVTNFHPAGQ